MSRIMSNLARPWGEAAVAAVLLGAVATGACSAESGEDYGDEMDTVSAPIWAGESDTFLPVVRIGTAVGWCTAVKVTEQGFITAAHCVENAADTNVRIIVKDSNGNHDLGVFRASTWRHPSYSPNAKDCDSAKHDAATIQLTTNKPISWPHTASIYTGTVNSNSAFHIYGWGYNSRNGTGSGQLRTGQDRARIFVDGAWSNHFNASAGTARICGGDSGGPATQGRYGPVAGLASSSEKTKTWKECAKPNGEMCWSRVEPKLPWISAQLNASRFDASSSTTLVRRWGYALYWDGELVGTEPSWNEATAVANCQWNRTTYPNKVVECWHNGHRLGYELYRDGSRDGFEPTFTRAQAQANCDWNRATYPAMDVDCLHNGWAL